MKLVLFGAGNIGRSFIAPLFAAGDYEVVFVDVNETILSEINRRGEYSVVVVAGDTAPEQHRVTGVRAIDARDADRVSEELATATIAATAVGKSALPAVAESIAAGIAERRVRNAGPLDVILAENVREAGALVRDAVEGHVGQTTDALGLVETSIGKMVPIVPADEARRDPLIVYAEAYNTLIVDRNGFTGPVPDLPGLAPVDNIRAYVDRKLFIHNLGHAACAYQSYAIDRSVSRIAVAIVDPQVRALTRQAMNQSAVGLQASYPEVFTMGELSEHIEDLVSRFANAALADTIHRVGRDLPRKLGRDDRIVGAMRMCAAHRLPFGAIASAYRAATEFLAPDESGAPYPADEQTVQRIREHGISWALVELSGLDPETATDAKVISEFSGS